MNSDIWWDSVPLLCSLKRKNDGRTNFDSVINVAEDKDELFLSVLCCFSSFIFILWWSDASLAAGQFITRRWLDPRLLPSTCPSVLEQQAEAQTAPDGQTSTLHGSWLPSVCEWVSECVNGWMRAAVMYKCVYLPNILRLLVELKAPDWAPHVL